MLTTTEALDLVEQATSPEALFGPRTTDPAKRKQARTLFHALASVLHPDVVGPTDKRAHAASATLTRLHHDWTHAATTTTPVDLKTRTGTYRITKPFAIGSIANLYDSTGPHVVKVVRNPALNPLLHSEWQALRQLERLTDTHHWLRPYYPRLLDTSGDVAKGSRAFTVLDPLREGFVTLADVQRAFPAGLDGRDYAWMHRRLLKALAGAHRIGLVHGAVTADNVMVHPEQHGIVLVGWSFAVEEGQRLLATSRTIAYPPEVEAGQPVTAATDVHMAHTLMLTMLAQTETRQRAFASGCRQERPGQRPDAVDLMREYDELLEELYGARRFRPFALPKTGE
ncbi:protein kinase family protein [Nocardia sp. NRRL S-836]|uniref:protein kinase family protein n=1 Tax=Nocardia sp. NRRL S-836 TaxID=1519492 RepID=UPI0006AF6C32|nr:protein kinase family protein [Nocardia sp. NRRL S-836]KOV77131.1 adenylate cyclase [Nocardia sp. NRRL S-836]